MEKLFLEFLTLIGFTGEIPANFTIGPDSELKDGEIVLGNMNDFEKSCNAFLQIKRKEHEQLHEKISAAHEGGNQDELLKLEGEHSLLKKVEEMTKAAMWASVYQRFPGESQKDDVSGIGFRVVDGNFKVVSMPADKDEMMMSALSELFGGGGFRAMILEGKRRRG